MTSNRALTGNMIAEIGALVGDPTRMTILMVLMDGRALTAGELASCAGVAASTASEHLRRLSDGGLLTVERQGRHRYFRLASPNIAELLESMMAVAADNLQPIKPVRIGPSDMEMRFARTCYNHLAGSLAVAVADCLVARGHLRLTSEAGSLERSGVEFLNGIGIIVESQVKGRKFCKACLDWSVRRPHIGGYLGAAVLTGLLDNGWIRKSKDNRVVLITPKGEAGFVRDFRLDLQALRQT